MKKILVLFLLLFIVSAGVFSMSKLPASESKTQDNLETEQDTPAKKSVFYEFDLKDVDGKAANLGQIIEGKAGLINIWATWCPPCRAEIPDLIKLRKSYKEKDIIVVGVSVDKNTGDVVKFAEQNNINYPVLMDDGSLSRHFGVRGIPTTLFINKKGEVVSKKIGFANKKYFQAEIEKIIGK